MNDGETSSPNAAHWFLDFRGRKAPRDETHETLPNFDFLASCRFDRSMIIININPSMHVQNYPFLKSAFFLSLRSPFYGVQGEYSLSP